MTNQEQPTEAESSFKGSPCNGNGETDMPEEKKKEQKVNDNMESSSSGSDGGKRSGRGSGLSGEGYSADCSSSDNSSLEAAKGATPVKEMKRLSVGDGSNNENPIQKRETKPSKSSFAPASGSQDGSDSSLSMSLNGEKSKWGDSSVRKASPENSAGVALSAPQWNGVRINNPMDPRIDLSTVCHIQTSILSTDISDSINNRIQQNGDEEPGPEQINDSVDHTTPALPSLDQYISLMEVVRPFFHAHGFSQDLVDSKSEEPTERPSSDYATGASEAGSDQKSFRQVRKLEVPVIAWNISQPSDAAHTARPDKEAQHSDSSSLVVLARAKRKKLKKSLEDQALDGASRSMNEGSNEGSNDLSLIENKIQMHQPQHAEASQNSQPSGNEPEVNANDGDGEQGVPQADAAEQRGSLSSSSSEGQNNQAVPQVAPVRYTGPPVVSEYSSSRTGGSGASNGNMMSTSGSGSGGNTGSGTGSGTASGSNQGGSSGSGNDHGGMSSNGNGSSGSGNDVKGSSEETMDNSGENNSGENSGGNSDEANSNESNAKNTVKTPVDAPHLTSGHRHTSISSEAKDLAIQAQPPSSIGKKDQNAVREKKLQDKKRKRMNMRREYEEKVEQEMESSEDSNGREEVVIKPGRPTTLDKVLSFTKIPRIVIKAGPPFFVVYTNAAYSRLSGVDSHMAVGKPVSTLLSIPDQSILKGQHATAELSQIENAAVALAAENARHKNPPASYQSGAIENHVTAEAAGRARATSAEDTVEMGLERLVAASGFGRYHAINVLAKPHHMLGRNVTVANTCATGNEANREDGSNGSGITSSHDGGNPFVTCNMSVSPVVSSPEAFDVAVVTDKDQDNHHHKNKRRKHHHLGESQQSPPVGHHQHRRNYMSRETSTHRKRHLITHYAIQLDQFDGTVGQFEGNGSQSSTSTTVEAQYLGMTKSELRRLRQKTTSADFFPPPQNAADDDEGNDDEMESESTDPKEAVTAIG